MYYIFCIHSSLEENLGSFQLLAIMNKVAMNVVEHVPLLYVGASFKYMPRSYVALSSRSTMFNFLRNHQTDFQMVVPACNTTSNGEVFLFLHILTSILEWNLKVIPWSEEPVHHHHQALSEPEANSPFIQVPWVVTIWKVSMVVSNLLHLPYIMLMVFFSMQGTYLKYFSKGGESFFYFSKVFIALAPGRSFNNYDHIIQTVYKSPLYIKYSMRSFHILGVFINAMP